jgi:hypothetical protein
MSKEYRYVVSTVRNKKSKIQSELMEQRNLNQEMKLVQNALEKVRNEGGRGEYGIGGSMNSSMKVSKRPSALQSAKKNKKK